MTDFNFIRNPVKAEFRRLKRLTEKKFFETKIELEKVNSLEFRLESSRTTFSFTQQQNYNDYLLGKVKNHEKTSSEKGFEFGILK